MHRDIVVIGGSAGSVDPLIHLSSRLSADFPAAVLAVLHIAPSSKGELAGLIRRAGALPCELAEDRRPVEPGRIYLARPDHHLLVFAGRLRVVHGPKENLARPAIDPLFRSAAQAYGPRTIGVILSGLLDDGAQGLAAIKRVGGVAVVQHPRDARNPSMPMNATLAADPDYRVPAVEIPELLERLVREPVSAVSATEAEAGAPGRSSDLPEARTEEAEAASGRIMSESALRALGRPSVLVCPDCGGVLFEIADSGVLRYRCSIGHAFGAHSLLAGKDGDIEEALSSALRALQESDRLTRRLLENLKERDFPLTRKELLAKAEEQRRHMQTIGALLDDLRPSEPQPE